jgi:hypothetical protein
LSPEPGRQLRRSPVVHRAVGSAGERSRRRRGPERPLLEDHPHRFRSLQCRFPVRRRFRWFRCGRPHLGSARDLHAGGRTLDSWSAEAIARLTFRVQ